MALGFVVNSIDRIPDRGQSFNTTPRVKTASFGDGYSQILPDGINTNNKVFTITFNHHPVAYIDDIVTFLELKAGATDFPFTYADDNGTVDGDINTTTINVIAKSWTKSFPYDNYVSLKIQLEQIFKP